MTSTAVVQLALDGGEVDLLVSDPPWGVDVVGGCRTLPVAERKAAGKKSIQNDGDTAEFPAFVKSFCEAFAAACGPGTPVYIKMGGNAFSLMDALLQGLQFHWSTNIVWAKQSLVVSHKDYHPQYEMIWYGWRDGAARKCHPVERNMSDLWSIDRPRISLDHPTMAPVALFARMIANSSKVGDLVLDTFGGSGTTLIACEQLGRRAALTELDPGYCDVIVERWQNFTGQKATRKRG